MLREEIKQVQEIAMIAAKTASMTVLESLTQKIAALESRIVNLESIKIEPEPAPKKAAKKEAE